MLEFRLGVPLATSRAGKIQQILSVYALAEDPNPQNHRWKKNKHLPVPAQHSAMLAALFRRRAVGYSVTQCESHLPVQDLSFQPETRMIEPAASQAWQCLGIQLSDFKFSA